MDRTFAKNAENTRSEEYAHLQAVRKDYPDYTVTLKTIKKKPNKECYKGLTYDYMKDYIRAHEPKETVDNVIAEFNELVLISHCHSKSFRYPVIKKWFLEKYPAIAMFGMEKSKEDKDTEENKVTEENKITDIPTKEAA
jgi:hypothetical protein